MRKTLFKMKFCAKTSRKGERATAKLRRRWRAGRAAAGAPPTRSASPQKAKTYGAG